MKELGNICTWTHDGWIRNIEVNQELKLILTLNRTQTREHKAALNSLLGEALNVAYLSTEKQIGKIKIMELLVIGGYYK